MAKTETHELLEEALALEKAGVTRALKKKFAGQSLTDEQIKAVISDNLMRKAVEAMLADFTPFDPTLVVEIAIRTAAIILTALPDESREWGTTFVAMGIHEAVDRKLSQGFKIGTAWDGGSTH